ncbi:MAG: hypothetical protein IPG71_10955 [bacterium]|nr:hypothetical protein [bacterium]
MEASQLAAHAAVLPVEFRVALHAACSVAEFLEAFAAFLDDEQPLPSHA